MDRFLVMSVFVAVADAQSFVGAARRMGMSPPAVTRAIAALEERLGTKLLTRTTRFVRTTYAGMRYLEHARRLIAEADEADDAAVGAHAAPRGQLVVTAPVLFGAMFVMPGIVDYLKRYPDVSVSALFLDRVVNLLEDGIDVGVRIGELPDSTMRAIPVGFVRRVVCASPRYLKEHGTPNEPADLKRHTIVASSAISSSTEWRFGTAKDAVTISVSPRLMVNNNDAAIRAALQGVGLTRLMSYQIAAHVAAGRLNRVLAAHEPPPMPIHVVHHEARSASGKVRSFVDLLVDRLRADTALG
jgi:DNA-binding transcriptional LysR family regulator